MSGQTYIAIDLKSFYASVECIHRGLDPLTTHLVVADPSRTEKTICLAVSPALKSFGISGRARLFEVVQRVQEVNTQRKAQLSGKTFSGKATDIRDLQKNPSLELDYIVAPPRMAAYMEASSAIYQIYLKYFAAEDIHVYSIDEVFIEATNYLRLYRLPPRELAQRILRDIQTETGITATAGIGTNLYLSKAAMDIVAKHMPADSSGTRIAQLDELSYRKLLWEHRPLTDFWRVGPGYRRKLEKVGLFTMGDIARCSLGRPGDFYSEDLLYKLFGIQAELLIDHAWGTEPCTMADIKTYRPDTKSVGSGQVLHHAYSAQAAALVVREMADLLVLDLVDKKLTTNQINLSIHYDMDNLTDPGRSTLYKGPVTTDPYGRKVPKHTHGLINLEGYTSSGSIIVAAFEKLYRQIVNPNLLVRRVYVTANNVLPESETKKKEPIQQLSLFPDAMAEEKPADTGWKERRCQQAILGIQKKYGKNALLKGMNLEEGATTITRNGQIGGHKA